MWTWWTLWTGWTWWTGRTRKERVMGESVYRIVEFVRVVCPRCGNARVPVQRTEKVWSTRAPLRVVATIRHHVCGGCGLRFQSQEAGAAGAAAEEVYHEGTKGTKKAGRGKR